MGWTTKLRFPSDAEIILFVITSRLLLGPTQLPVRRTQRRSLLEWNSPLYFIISRVLGWTEICLSFPILLHGIPIMHMEDFVTLVILSERNRLHDVKIYGGYSGMEKRELVSSWKAQTAVRRLKTCYMYAWSNTVFRLLCRWMNGEDMWLESSAEVPPLNVGAWRMLWREIL